METKMNPLSSLTLTGATLGELLDKDFEGKSQNDPKAPNFN